MGEGFISCYETTSAPDVTLFIKIKSKCNSIDLTKYCTYSDNKEMRQVINKDKRKEIILFAQMALNTEKYRHDYKEFL